MTSAPVTIALTRYEEPSWLLDAALASLSAQRHVVAQVLVLDQSYDAAAERRCRVFTSRCVSFHYTTIPPVGLSWARNHGIRRSETDILLFIDPDAVAEPTWAMELAATLSEPKVAVAGARIVGAWHGRSPLLARANVVRYQYSLLDLGEEARPARKVVGTGFGIRAAYLPSEVQPGLAATPQWCEGDVRHPNVAISSGVPHRPSSYAQGYAGLSTSSSAHRHEGRAGQRRVNLNRKGPTHERDSRLGSSRRAADLRWKTWASDPEGITGDGLLDFTDKTLFPALKGMEGGPKVDGDSAMAKVARALRSRRLLLRSVFEDAYQYMKSGTLLRHIPLGITPNTQFSVRWPIVKVS